MGGINVGGKRERDSVHKKKDDRQRGEEMERERVKGRGREERDYHQRMQCKVIMPPLCKIKDLKSPCA